MQAVSPGEGGEGREGERGLCAGIMNESVGVSGCCLPRHTGSHHQLLTPNTPHIGFVSNTVCV